jgi:hypothetical protein
MDQSFNAALEFINKAGTLGTFLLIAAALWKKQLVLGWQYAEKDEELETCRIVANAYATKTEAKLERLEQQLDTHRVARPLAGPDKAGPGHDVA